MQVMEMCRRVCACTGAVGMNNLKRQQPREIRGPEPGHTHTRAHTHACTHTVFPSFIWQRQVTPQGRGGWKERMKGWRKREIHRGRVPPESKGFTHLSVSFMWKREWEKKEGDWKKDRWRDNFRDIIYFCGFVVSGGNLGVCWHGHSLQYYYYYL